MKTIVAAFVFFLIATAPSIAKEPASAPATQPATTQAAVKRLEIKANIDGSDELHISREGLAWMHKLWQWPTDIQINGQPWDPQQAPLLPSDDASVGLDPDDLKPERVTILEKEGRDTVAVEAVGDEIVIYFCDGFGGADAYRVVLEFGSGAAKR